MSNLADDAGEAGHRVADVVKGEAKSVGREARRQAKRFADQVGTEVRQQAATQQSRAASGLRTVGDDFSTMASGADSGSGFAADLVGQAGDRVGAAAQWLDDRDPRAVLEEVKRFARRRPGVFIAIAIGAGVIVGRVTRAIMQGDDSDATIPADSMGRAGLPADRRRRATAVTGKADRSPIDPVTGGSRAEGIPSTTSGGM